MKKIRFVLFLLSVTLLVSTTGDVLSQCSVCRVSAESNINKHENGIGRGLNKGILYLMVVPYAMVGIGFFIWYKQRKKVA